MSAQPSEINLRRRQVGVDPFPGEGWTILLETRPLTDINGKSEWRLVYFGSFHPNAPGKTRWRDAWTGRPVRDPVGGAYWILLEDLR